jgi:hypothetical protein
VGRLGGPSGPPWRGPCPVCLSEACLTLVFFAGFKWGFPSCLRGPLGLSPTVAPEHLRVRRPGSRRCWSLLIGRPPPGLRVLSVGPRQRTRGSSPRSSAGAWALLQGFCRGIWSGGVVHISTDVGNVSADFGDARAAGTIRGWCNPGGVAVCRAPEPGPVRGDRVELYDLFLTRPRRPFAGRRVRFPQPPSVGSWIADSSLSC